MKRELNQKQPPSKKHKSLITIPPEIIHNIIQFCPGTHLNTLSIISNKCVHQLIQKERKQRRKNLQLNYKTLRTKIAIPLSIQKSGYLHFLNHKTLVHISSSVITLFDVEKGKILNTIKNVLGIDEECEILDDQKTIVFGSPAYQEPKITFVNVFSGEQRVLKIPIPSSKNSAYNPNSYKLYPVIAQKLENGKIFVTHYENAYIVDAKNLKIEYKWDIIPIDVPPRVLSSNNVAVVSEFTLQICDWMKGNVLKSFSLKSYSLDAIQLDDKGNIIINLPTEDSGSIPVAQVFNVETGECIMKIKCTSHEGISTVLKIDDERFLVVVENELQLYNWKLRKYLYTIKIEDTGEIQDATLLGKDIVAIYAFVEERYIMVWDVSQKQCIAKFNVGENDAMDFIESMGYGRMLVVLAGKPYVWEFDIQ